MLLSPERSYQPSAAPLTPSRTSYSQICCGGCPTDLCVLWSPSPIISSAPSSQSVATPSAFTAISLSEACGLPPTRPLLTLSFSWGNPGGVLFNAAALVVAPEPGSPEALEMQHLGTCLGGKAGAGLPPPPGKCGEGIHSNYYLGKHLFSSRGTWNSTSGTSFPTGFVISFPHRIHIVGFSLREKLVQK